MVANMKRIFRGLIAINRLNLLFHPSTGSARLGPPGVVREGPSALLVTSCCFKGSSWELPATKYAGNIIHVLSTKYFFSVMPCLWELTEKGSIGYLGMFKLASQPRTKLMPIKSQLGSENLSVVIKLKYIGFFHVPWLLASQLLYSNLPLHPHAQADTHGSM